MAVMALSSFSMLISCQQNEKQSQDNPNGKPKYFDLPDYFQKEIDLLSKANPEIEKTVSKDDLEETKRLKIKDWELEFSSFKNIDLNKSAYAEFIQVDSANNVLQYSFNNPKSDLSCVRIEMDSLGQPKIISIQRDVVNNLYHTAEFLVYEKGKYYLVEKKQDVKVMGDNQYRVLGNF
ncbi:hypothetical protein GCM10022216_00240 [Sphingobacterium kyonggiense]|uniref:PepSY-like beta-lactamase-inhibitor n=1 Tax=Sphingobacterium kyonggiense TaxID=714075 RepID=A0ABP7Y513_9SPHI